MTVVAVLKATGNRPGEEKSSFPPAVLAILQPATLYIKFLLHGYEFVLWDTHIARLVNRTYLHYITMHFHLQPPAFDGASTTGSSGSVGATGGGVTGLAVGFIGTKPGLLRGPAPGNPGGPAAGLPGGPRA